jgi:pimeloyl-ACP methyl ester carboxylesterase
METKSVSDAKSTVSERPLARYGGRRPDAPEWHRQAMATPMETMSVEVDGAAIEVLAWGDPAKPGVLLAHGMRSHARWWGPVAPLLAADHRVVALSYSGMGGSDWREAYSLELEVDELFAAARAGGLLDGPAPPIFVGHSFGARAVALAAQARGEALAGAILIDSAIGPLDYKAVDSVEAKPRVYPDLETALSRFVLQPHQACENHFILDDIARAGLVECDGGWRWRFDPMIVRKLRQTSAWDALARTGCALGMIYGGRSLHGGAAIRALQQSHLPAGTPFLEIPDAGNHVMLDQPIALAVAIRALGLAWFSRAKP